MTRHSKVLSIVAGSVFALGSIIAPNVLTTMPTFAEGDNPVKSVYVDYQSGVGGEDLYVDTGCQSNAASTATYCADGKVLTLNNYSGNQIYISGIEENVTLKLQGTNTLVPSAGTNYLVFNPNGGLVIDGDGTLKASNVKTLFYVKKEITMNSGTVEFSTTSSSDATEFASSDATMTLNNGTIKYDVPAPIEESAGMIGVYGSFKTGDFVMNGGSIIAPNAVMEPGSGTRNSFSLKGGNINIFAVQGKSIDIAGGELTANSVVNSVNLLSAETTLAFNGGKTTLKKPVSDYPFAVAAADQMIFANNMCVTGDARLENQGSSAFLVMGSSDTVVIQQGTCGNNPFPVNPDPTPTPDDPGANPGNSPKVPNTGFETSQAILATIIALPTIVAAIILGRFFYYRYNQHVSFKK